MRLGSPKVPGRHFIEVACMPKLREIFMALKELPVAIAAVFALVMIGAVAISLLT